MTDPSYFRFIPNFEVLRFATSPEPSTAKGIDAFLGYCFPLWGYSWEL
jgi:hypothetical protein